jgi:glucose-1-phosphate thymidylyltransferase
VEIHNAIVGPHVSIGANTKVKDSIVSNSIIQENAHIENANITNSMVGNHAKYHGSKADLSIGDYNVIK